MSGRPMGVSSKAGMMLGLATLLIACSGNSTEVDVVYRSDHCGTTGKGVYQLTSPQELAAVMKNKMNPLDDTKNLAPDVDFSENQLVLVAWGSKPNPGYKIELTSPQAVRDGKVLRLPVAFQEPDLGAFYPQVMTSPCIVLSVPVGDYEAIAAGDWVTDVDGAGVGRKGKGS
jgi:hypothetical protein